MSQTEHAESAEQAKQLKQLSAVVHKKKTVVVKKMCAFLKFQNM